MSYLGIQQTAPEHSSATGNPSAFVGPCRRKQPQCCEHLGEPSDRLSPLQTTRGEVDGSPKTMRRNKGPGCLAGLNLNRRSVASRTLGKARTLASLTFSPDPPLTRLATRRLHRSAHIVCFILVSAAWVLGCSPTRRPEAEQCRWWISAWRENADHGRAPWREVW